jgi:nucleoside-diphosphate-sugar epimerase
MRMLSRKSAAYSNEKAQHIFGYQPEFTLQQGMQHALQWAYGQGLCKEEPHTDTATAN